MDQAAAVVKSELNVHPIGGTTENRWWVYQRERFPLLAHGPLIAAFSVAAIGYSVLARGASSLPGPRQTFVAFACSFLFFLQLRLADEFKDYEEDLRYRPYRAVPRGLIKLRELAYVWAGCVALQLTMAIWLSHRLLPLLIGVWAYLLLMSKEFFVRGWLKRHAILYMLTHMVIMPLIFLFASACDWVPAGYAQPSQGLVWMILVNFFLGMVIEIGRKIRAPADEEHRVETYSTLWGRSAAVVAWLIVMTASAAAAYPAARSIHFVQIELALLPVIFASIATAVVFLRRPHSGRGKWIQTISGVWALLTYLSLGALPLWLHFLGGQK